MRRTPRMETRSIFPHLEKSGKAGSAKSARGAASAAVAEAMQCLGMRLDVVLADACARAGSLDRVNVHAQFAGQAPHVGRGGNRLAMFDARHLAQLRRHAERFLEDRWQIGRQRLFFGFSFGSHGRLEGEARRLLPGTMFDGSMVDRLEQARWLRLRA